VLNTAKEENGTASAPTSHGRSTLGSYRLQPSHLIPCPDGIPHPELEHQFGVALHTLANTA
jgi:hypothetical protein